MSHETRPALGNGCFSEMSMFGTWVTTPAQDAAAVDRYATEIGGLLWAAPQDWVCEPFIVAKTRRSVQGHQVATVVSVLDLRVRVTTTTVIPVLQGWTLADYLTCVDLYDRAGIDLTREPVIGLGSVRRRQATGTIAAIAAELAGLGLYGRHLISADSLAWSYAARYRPPMQGADGGARVRCDRADEGARSGHAGLSTQGRW